MLPEETIDSQLSLSLLPIVFLAAVVPQRPCSKLRLKRLFIKVALFSVFPVFEDRRALRRDGEIWHGSRVGEEL